MSFNDKIKKVGDLMNRHYFIAVPIPKEIKEQINEWRQNNQDQLHFKNWVHLDDYHITLVFLGHVNEMQLIKLEKVMNAIQKQFSPFSLTISHVGTFGNAQKPRIFWAGIKESKALIQLQKTIYECCEKVGFSLDKRPYSPHLTLARKWNGEELFVQSDFQFEQTMTFEVQSFSLFETHLDKSPKYEVRKNWTF
jgi:RNA 2',3'-cyclic 3'-phosphodiesterase